ncbi:MAG TPA: helix-turn-helix domain-containing protein [Candidatus Limnocylindrales bacterium]|nr:helix-turn-helix domain-containing protein [Candidatus Limnocylindrales bacterium]
MPKRYGQACPVAKALELIGDRWTLLLVRDLLGGTRRFQELAASQTGIAPNILSDRLKLMEQHGLATREFYSDHPPRARYTLTERGRELGWVVGALAVWGSRHVYQRARLVHADCGHEVKLGYHCAHCETRVRGGTVKVARVGAAKGGRPAKRPVAPPPRARGRRPPPRESR